METFGKRLKRTLDAQGLSQSKLAEKVARSKGAVTQWVHDDTEPDLQTLTRICEILKVSADYLIRGVDSRYLDEHTARIADRLQHLPPDQRAALRALIFGTTTDST